MSEERLLIEVIVLSAEDIAAIEAVVPPAEVAGGRYW